MSILAVWFVSTAKLHPLPQPQPQPPILHRRPRPHPRRPSRLHSRLALTSRSSSSSMPNRRRMGYLNGQCSRKSTSGKLFRRPRTNSESCATTKRRRSKSTVHCDSSPMRVSVSTSTPTERSSLILIPTSRPRCRLPPANHNSLSPGRPSVSAPPLHRQQLPRVRVRHTCARRPPQPPSRVPWPFQVCPPPPRPRAHPSTFPIHPCLQGVLFRRHRRLVPPFPLNRPPRTALLPPLSHRKSTIPLSLAAHHLRSLLQSQHPPLPSPRQPTVAVCPF